MHAYAHACKCEQLLAHRICVHVQARGAGLFTGKPDFRLRKDLHCVILDSGSRTRERMVANHPRSSLALMSYEGDCDHPCPGSSPGLNMSQKEVQRTVLRRDGSPRVRCTHSSGFNSWRTAHSATNQDRSGVVGGIFTL